MLEVVINKIPKNKYCVIPIYSGLICIATILCTYVISRYYHHYPDWLYLPFISLMGFRMPERLIYAVGFTSAGLGYLVIAIKYNECVALLDLIDTHFKSQLATLASQATYVCIFGLIIQACIPLQSDIVESMSNPNIVLKTQSMIHQSGAGVLFLMALIHGFVTVYLIRSQNKYRNWFSLFLKEISSVIMLLCIFGSMFYHPTAASANAAHAEMIYGAMCQWTLVFSMIVMFGSYYFELKYIYKNKNNE